MRRIIQVLLGLIIFSSLIVGVQPCYAQKSTSMTFTSTKGQGATKNWSADTCYATIDANKTLTITGQFATGRTDVPYQAMVITINKFAGLASLPYAISNATFEDIWTENGKPKIVKTSIVFSSTAPVFVSDFDLDKNLLGGSFAFDMTSHPPSGNDFVTNVTGGYFKAAMSLGIILEVSPTTVVKTNTGSKINFNVYAKNLLNVGVKGCELFVTDDLGKIKDTKVGTTSSKGQYVYTVDIPKDAKTDKYKVSFYVKNKINGEEVISNTVERTLDVSGRYWVYNCANSPLMTFDAGDGNEFKSDDPLPTISATGKINLNDVVTLDGTVTIDPRKGVERLTGNYTMYIDNVNIAATNQQLLIEKGIGMSFNCANLLKWDTPGVLAVKIGGIEFSLDELSFADLNFAKAVKFKVTAQWGNLYKDNCTTNSNQPEFSSLSGGLTIANEELDGVKIEGFEIGATNLSTAAFPGFCIDNVALSYEPIEDSWKFTSAAEYSTPDPAKTGQKLFQGKAKIEVTSKKGHFDGFVFEGKKQPGMPCGEIPFEWIGLRLATSGWSNKTSWKGYTAEIAGFFLSDDALIKNEIPWLTKVLGEESLIELEIVGNIAYTGPKITGTVNARMFANKKISVTNKWQVVASGTFGADLTDGFEFGILDGSINALHFGAKDYVLSVGSGYKDAIKIKKNDISYFYNSGATIVRIPDIPSDPVNTDEFGPFWKFITHLKAMGFFPKTLGTASSSMMLSSTQGLEFNGMVDVTTSGIPIISTYGSLSIKAGIKNGSPYMKFGGAFPSIFSSAQKRKYGEDTPLENLPNGQLVKANAIDTFEVTSNMKRAFIMLTSNGKLSASSLITPSGVTITGTKSDSSIILFDTPDGTFAQWALIAPEVGSWIIKQAPGPTDSIFIYSLNKDRSFDITAIQSGKNVNVSWDGTGYQPEDYLDIFIDSKNNNFAGKYIGRISASFGKYAISLSDSLTECSYYVYATRIALGTAPITKYADGQFSVNKTWLTAPSNIRLVSNQFGNCNLTFTPSTDTSTSRYGIYITSPNGGDSLISVGYPNQMPISFNCDTALVRSIYIVSLNNQFYRGCPAKPQSITVDVQEENPSVGNPETLDFTVIPNPATTNAEVRFILPDERNLKLTLYDMFGNRIVNIAQGFYNQGIFRTALDLKGVASGSYFIKLETGSTVVSKLFQVMK